MTSDQKRKRKKKKKASSHTQSLRFYNIYEILSLKPFVSIFDQPGTLDMIAYWRIVFLFFIMQDRNSIIT